MLTIKKEELNDKLECFLKEISCDENLTDKIVMTAKDGDEYLGVGALELRIDKVYLNFVATKEDELTLKLGIMKSLLNLADLRGIKTVYGDNESLQSLYRMLRFKESDGRYILELKGYFTCGC